MEHCGDEADITMTFYVIDAAISSNSVIRVLSDDSYMFVLLIYSVYREEMEGKVQLQRWDALFIIIIINTLLSEEFPG